VWLGDDVELRDLRVRVQLDFKTAAVLGDEVKPCWLAWRERAVDVVTVDVDIAAGVGAGDNEANRLSLFVAEFGKAANRLAVPDHDSGRCRLCRSGGGSWRSGLDGRSSRRGCRRARAAGVRSQRYERDEERDDGDEDDNHRALGVHCINCIRGLTARTPRPSSVVSASG